VQILSSSDRMFEGIKDEWSYLASQCAATTPFQTVEWQSVWWTHFGRGKRPLAIALYEGKDLVGLMPFTVSGGPWRTIRPMGVGPSDYLQPIAATGYEELVATELAGALNSLPGIDLIDLQQLRQNQSLGALLEGPKLDQATCLVLDLPTTFTDYLATLGKSLRYDVKKLDKKVVPGGPATIKTFGPGETDLGLDVLFHLHRLRWRKRLLPGAFVGRLTAFHRDWARVAAPAGFLWLTALYVDGVPVGSIYAMRYGKTVYYYQAGFDPTQGSISPGTLLVAHAIRRAIEEGANQFDFMRGDEPYKRRWKPQRELHNFRYLRPSSSFRGQVGDKYCHFSFRMETRIRERLEGKGLL
jgi:CelD/BcsL family acetyltransferase involved in cellulose biosynthesis